MSVLYSFWAIACKKESQKKYKQNERGLQKEKERLTAVNRSFIFNHYFIQY